MEKNKDKFRIASLALGITSILCSIPGFFLLLIRQSHPDTIINTIITLSIVALISGLAGIVAGCTGTTLAILQKAKNRAELISLNLAGIILSLLILLIL